MHHERTAVVTGKDGLQGTIVNETPSGVTLKLENGRQILIPTDALVLQADGSYYLPLSAKEIDPHGSGGGHRDDETLIIPVKAEEAKVHKREEVTGRVRINKEVRERVEVIDEPLLREEVEVRRVTVNQPVSGPVSPRYEGDTLIVPVVEEVLMVEKRLLVKEELYITKRQIVVHEPQEVTLREEQVKVERINTKDEGAGR